MDFIISLRKMRFHHDALFVIIDYLTKVAHFILENTLDDAPTVAHKFIKEIVTLHGFPEIIVSDRDPKFTSLFWRTLHQAFGTKLNMSLAYHPQTDGQIKRVNRVLKDMLQMYCMDQKIKWEDYLYLVEFAYNNSYHSSLGMAPFEVLYGRKYKTPLSWDNLEDRVFIRSDHLKEMEEQLKMIQKRLKEAFDHQKSYANLKRTHREFFMGDKVFLQVFPMKSAIKSTKLDPCFVGLFEIIRKVSPMAYKLALPPNLSKIHEVFHISLLRKYIFYPSHVLDLTQLQMSDPMTIEVLPVRVLGFRSRKLRNREIKECLIQWDQYSESFATWEDIDIIKE